MTWEVVLDRLAQLDWRIGQAPFSAVWTAERHTMQTGADFTKLLGDLVLVHIAPVTKAQIQRARKSYRDLTRATYPVSDESLVELIVSPPA